MFSFSHGRHVVDYHLRRNSVGEEPLYLDEMLDLMAVEEPVDAASWDHFNLTWGYRKVSLYSVSLPNLTYIVHSINVNYMAPPRMKHRDMIVDNYKAAGGDLATLKRIGVSFITNQSAYDCVYDAFTARGIRMPEKGSSNVGSVVELVRNRLFLITPNSCGWKDLVVENPFIVGQRKMLLEYAREFNNARIEKVTVAAHERPSILEGHLLFMVTHLTRDPNAMVIDEVADETIEEDEEDEEDEDEDEDEEDYGEELEMEDDEE
ncbi:hypothetical protein F5Y11DRAFT_361615 [Daldinia sp. FL1419]|nr:hypothetical protein F5Y11DRAFT_361615 [Daldinia sp. FL1419]